MTELERLLTAQFERMEQRHQDETMDLRAQLDAQQRALKSLQAQLRAVWPPSVGRIASIGKPRSLSFWRIFRTASGVIGSM